MVMSYGLHCKGQVKIETALVIGVAAIGYYGYQWISQNVAAPAPGGGATEVDPHLAFEDDPY